jgi:hypothetical protein
MTTKSMGKLDLPLTPPDTVHEVCAQLTAMHNTSQPLPPRNGKPAPQIWFFHLFNLRFVLLDGQGNAPAAAGSTVKAPAAGLPAAISSSAADKHTIASNAAAASGALTAAAAAKGSAAAAAPSTSKAANSTAAVAVAAAQTPSDNVSPPVGMPADVPMHVHEEPAHYQNFQPTENMLELERQLRAAANAAGGVTVAMHGQPELDLPAAVATSAASKMRLGSSSSGSSSSSGALDTPASPEQVWRQLQRQHQWPDGQLVFESMYRPCVADEANEMCVEDCGLM